MNHVCFSFSKEALVRDSKRALAGLLAFAAICLAAHCGSGCKALQDAGGPTAIEQSYTAEIVGCAYTAGRPGPYDAEEDRKCRADVNCRYKLGPCDTDGGK